MTIHFEKLDSAFESASAPLGLVTSTAKAGLYHNIPKRLLDIAFAIVSAPIVVPVVLLLALVIARDGHNPFYWSKRVGLGGREFRMLKLRTMVPAADRLLKEYLATNPDARREWETTQKLKCDPRITRVGRFLRRSSLDELPQLWNVLVGDMSIVGPRPMLPCQREMYPGFAYYALRPGITGQWQVSVRNNSEFADRAEFDNLYFERMSFFTDVKLISQTVRVVLRGTGH